MPVNWPGTCSRMLPRRSVPPGPLRPTCTGCQNGLAAPALTGRQNSPRHDQCETSRHGSDRGSSAPAILVPQVEDDDPIVLQQTMEVRLQMPLPTDVVFQPPERRPADNEKLCARQAQPI